MAKQRIVEKHAVMWPREVFEKFPPPVGAGRKKILAKSLQFLDGPGVYILYRNDQPYYIGQATKLIRRLGRHAIRADGRYFHFWNFFSAFLIRDAQHRNAIEGILITAMPSVVNSAKPKLPKDKMPAEVKGLLRKIYGGRAV